MWLLVAPRAAKVLMVMRASGSSRPILASTPRNGVVRGSQPETTARKSSRRLTRRCPVALQTRLTQVGRALKQLGIEHIPSDCPEGRGRMERLFGTLQSRLPPLLRQEGLASIEAA